MSIILLRRERYLELAKLHGHHTYEAQALAAGLGIATIHRLRNDGPAGPRAVAALCDAYGVEFADLFALGSTASKPVRAAA
ncbi:helix-turn-helix domain-containing protein [Streptomyces sp. NBC_00649]|uniref:helix-turn-helix domain-containing protein n=1 Tax=Streptomyces sp. NBC_00649 TaxID=2975798 RepID=UPI00324CFEC5